ncbi:MAG: hypothetical protein LBG70_04795, partial [Bifidobacteriaceae bacterium]|nr:hypothetical protein [Bifidobacteriaceae bacterium]
MTRIHTSSNAVVYLLVAAVTGLAGGGIVPANAATSNDGAYTPFATEAISHIGSTAYADIFGNNQRRLADPASLLKALAASQEPLRASRLGAVTLANGWADLALRTIALNNPAAYGGQVGQTEAVLDALAPCWPQSTTQPDDRTDPAASPTISSDPTTSALPNHDTGPLPAAAASAGLQPTNWPGQPAIVGLVEQPTATAASLADLDFQIRQANPALPANPDLAIQTDKSPVIYTTYRLTVQGGACGEKTTDTAYGLVVALHDPTLAFVNNGQILGSGIAPNHTTWADAANDTNSSGLSMQTTDFPPRYSQGVTNQSGVSLTVQQTLPSNSQLTLSEQIADSNLHKFATAIGSDTPATHQIPLLSETNQQFNLTLGANALFGEAAATSRSITVSNQTDSPATVTLPAHTALEIAEIGRLETAKLDHDIPLAIGYQVTVVEWNTATDLNHTLAHFGSATDDAHSDLEMRRNKSDDSEIMWTSQSASLDDPAKQILDKLQHAPLISAQTAWSGNLGKDLAGLVTGRPMIRVPAQLVHQIRSSTRSVAKIIPLYPLARTASPTLGTVELNSGQRLALDQLSVTGYDADDIPFYGFNVRNGSWTLTDDSGRPLDNDNTEGVATISHQPFTG